MVNYRVRRCQFCWSQTGTQQLVQDYAKDRKMKQLIERLKKSDRLQSSYRWKAKEGQLLLETEGRWRLCIPAGPLRLELLLLCHDNASAGHPGRDRTYSKLTRDFTGHVMEGKWQNTSKRGIFSSLAKGVKHCRFHSSFCLSQANHGKAFLWILSRVFQHLRGKRQHSHICWSLDKASTLCSNQGFHQCKWNCWPLPRRFRLPSLHVLHVWWKFCVIRAAGRNLQFLHVWARLREKSIVHRHGQAQERAQEKLERNRRWFERKKSTFLVRAANAPVRASKKEGIAWLCLSKASRAGRLRTKLNDLGWNDLTKTLNTH